MGAITTVRNRYGRMLSAELGRFGFHSSYLSLLEENTLRGLRTHAIPAGVTALRSPRLLWLSYTVMSTKNNPAKEIHVASCGSRGLGETPQCVCTRGLISKEE